MSVIPDWTRTLVSNPNRILRATKRWNWGSAVTNLRGPEGQSDPVCHMESGWTTEKDLCRSKNPTRTFFSLPSALGSSINVHLAFLCKCLHYRRLFFGIPYLVLQWQGVAEVLEYGSERYHAAKSYDRHLAFVRLVALKQKRIFFRLFSAFGNHREKWRADVTRPQIESK